MADFMCYSVDLHLDSVVGWKSSFNKMRFLKHFNRCLSLPVLSLEAVVIIFIVIFIVKADANSLESSSPGPSSSQNSKIPNDGPKKLKSCQGFEVTSGTVQIPTYNALESKYEKIDYEVGEMLTFCGTGKEPNSEGVLSITQNRFNTYLSEVSEESNLALETVRLQRKEVFLLDSGYLSVGLNGTAWYYSPDEFCVADIRGSDEDTVVEFRTCDFDLLTRPLYPKCCPFGMVLNSGCIVPPSEVGGMDFFNKTSRRLVKFEDVNPIFISPTTKCDDGEAPWPWEFDNCSLVFHPATDNSVAFIGAHRTWEFLKPDVIKCFEYAVDEYGTKQAMVFPCTSDTNNISKNDKKASLSTIYMVTMYVGAGFNLLTTIVYLATWKKQNIHGKTLCSCTASLFCMQIFLGTAHLLGLLGFKDLRDSTICFLNGVGGQFFMIAAFTWLLVVNMDLWRTFGSIRAGGSKSLKRFLLYSGLGWGFPFLGSLVSIALEFAFTCRSSGVPVPEYGEHYCFVSPWSQGFYVYYILGCLIALSFLFAILTWLGLYNLKKGTGNLRSSKSAEQQNVLLYLKLGVVMGLSWIFEVVSWAFTDENQSPIAWSILDFYNALSAILIFIIFVCKKTIWKMLEETLPFLRGLPVAVRRFSSGVSASENFTSTTEVPRNTSSTSVTSQGQRESRETSFQ